MPDLRDGRLVSLQEYEEMDSMSDGLMEGRWTKHILREKLSQGG